MKYNAEMINATEWAVTAKAGKEYLPHTVTTDETEARLLAVVYSMEWHQEQIDKLFSKGQRDGLFAEGDFASDYID